jgi:replicative DNA helicase
MYWVRQNTGMDYRVNESHILSLKRSGTEGPHTKGDIVNIEVKEYLSKAPKWKSNYKGYKVGVEFDYKDVPLEAYLMGLWLGDDKSDSFKIFSQDPEVVDYISTDATLTGQSLSVYQPDGKCPSYSITGGKSQTARDKSIQAVLRSLNLLNNKHIPQVYLTNSRRIRLLLLAGLIDSDGYVDPNSPKIEITTKYEHLGRQIKFLCDTLGFRTTLKKKRATISSVGYESTVWRIHIGGNIDEIPTLIKRKKGKDWTDRKDWTVTGITVEQDKVDDYYGFVIDGNHLFLLEDCTVTHNTAFALNLCRAAALNPTKPTGVALFSLEMSAGQLVQRILAAESEIHLEKISRGKMEEHEMKQLYAKGIQRLAQAPIFIDDTAALNIFELRAKCRRLKNQGTLGLIIIDYLQLMSGTGDRNSNREQEISTISRGLKGLAKELQVPIIALSQLSREVEKRKDGNKMPQLSDLRESGAIEQDADMVMFLYRPEYYDITQDEMGDSNKGETHVRIAKHRNGSLETIKLKALLHIQKFIEWDDGGGFGNFNMPSNFKPVSDTDGGGGARMFIQTGSKMNDLPDEEDPF